MKDKTSTNLDDPECLLWAGKVCAKWQSILEAIIDTGKLLLEAKEALSHSKWSPFVKDYLRFKLRTAERLMAIAQDSRLTNPTHAPYLPPHWTTLYVLTQLSDHWFQQGLDSTAIRPDMERADAEDLLRLERIQEFDRDRGDADLERDLSPNPLEIARKTYFTECRKQSVKGRARELQRCFDFLSTWDEEVLAMRQRRRENAEETEFLLAQSFAGMREEPGHEEMETTS
jgi:hypothetical protein